MTYPWAIVIVAGIAAVTWLISLIIDRKMSAEE